MTFEATSDRSFLKIGPARWWALRTGVIASHDTVRSYLASHRDVGIVKVEIEQTELRELATRILHAPG